MIRLSAVSLLLLLAPVTVRAAELVMVEQLGCEWCEAWDAEVGVVYDRTPEGKRAPLRRIDIHDPLPRDLRHIKGLVFTPTFVLVEGGKEIGRIRGYPGEDFFWGLLGQLLEKLPDRQNAKTPAGVSPDAAPRTGERNEIRG